ncbi:hypothetical protein EsDP_00002195 [Epichloe bromicola]|uniref:DUF3669 domain-containing protein n=1 Tax=Epichloe bromicola TaxID=79588 RepID=A0ABQ0CK31_9HYPO
MNATNLLTDFGPLERIGHGHCGSVWGTLGLEPMEPMDGTHGSARAVVKREDASPGRDIRNEVSVQSQVSACATGGMLPRVLVPKCFGFMSSLDERWTQLLPLLPAGFDGCRAMIAEKIEPVSTPAQLLLIDRYGPEEHRDELRESLLCHGKREHCLARIYLGRRRQMHHPDQRQQRPRFFSLRNLPIHADQAEELHLPCEEYAKSMAEALAVLHWRVRTNGADVEFVLGACREAGTADVSTPLGEHAIWMLDFDCSRPIEADESGLESMTRAFWRNDPYYPQPHSAHERDRQLWDIFAAEYRRVGMEVVRAYPREGEDVEVLCALVDGVLTKIVETKGKWKSGGHF